MRIFARTPPLIQAPAPEIPVIRVSVLAAVLIVAGAVHVLVGLEHGSEHGSSTFPMLSMVAGIAQVMLGIAVVFRPSTFAIHSTLFLTFVLMELYAMNVTLGLPPLIAHAEDTTTHQLLGITLAAPNEIEPEGLLAQGAQILAVLFAISLDKRNS